MTAGAVPSIDHHDVGVGVFDQGVDEPHPERPGADDEVVGLHLALLAHDVTLCDGRAAAPGQPVPAASR